MKKFKSIFVIGLLFLFSSCIVKSIRPFYLKEHVKFNENLIGNWTTGKTKSWQIV